MSVRNNVRRGETQVRAPTRFFPLLKAAQRMMDRLRTIKT